jgi:hypothetical protein
VGDGSGFNHSDSRGDRSSDLEFDVALPTAAATDKIGNHPFTESTFGKHP